MFQAKNLYKNKDYATKLLETVNAFRKTPSLVDGDLSMTFFILGASGSTAVV